MWIAYGGAHLLAAESYLLHDLKADFVLVPLGNLLVKTVKGALNMDRIDLALAFGMLCLMLGTLLTGLVSLSGFTR